MRIGIQTWGSEGDTRPFAALASALVNSGHQVTLVIADNAGRDYSGLAEQGGFNLVSIANPEMPSPEKVTSVWRSLIDAGNPLKQAEIVLKYGFDPVMEGMFVEAKNLCASCDLLIGHFFVYPLRVAAELAGKPVITVNIVHNCIPSREIPPPGIPNLGRWFYPIGWSLVRATVNKIFLRRVNGLRLREGLKEDTDVMSQSWASPLLNLVAVSPSICQRPPDWEARHKVCGFLNPPTGEASIEMPTGLEEFLCNGQPPIYITFGSMMLDDAAYMNETADIWIEAIGLVGCRAIIQLPTRNYEIENSNEKIFLVDKSPYRDVFPRCSLVVHHGGAGTTQSSLLAGKPSIVVAHMADQFFWGSELERLQVGGPTLRRKGLRAPSLAKSIQIALSNPQLALNARELGKQLESEDGVSIAVKLIEGIKT